jgi:hypothetical protein
MNGIAVVVLSVLLLAGPAGAEWAVKPGAGGGTGCVLESTPESLTDGYQTTTARIRVDGKTVTVSSPSVLDPGSKDIGLQVDQHDSLPMDRLADPRAAVFEASYATVVEQFKLGARARVQLRFWPTWPATGVHSATFSLIGFTRAYVQLSECK